MTSSSKPRSFGQAQIHDSTSDTQNATLSPLRQIEHATDNAIAASHLGGKATERQKIPEAKPWAHFVAGAYVPTWLIESFQMMLIC